MMTAGERKFKDISLILKDLLKVIKVVSMYPEDNPLPQSLRRSFAEKLESIVAELGDISVAIAENKMTHMGETVFHSSSKEENLAGIFYNCGITEITFKTGLGVLEIYRLLDTIKTFLNSPDKAQDLAALIWETGISGFALKTLEDVALSQYDNSFSIQEYVAGGSESSDHQGVFGAEPSAGYHSIFASEEDSDKWERPGAESPGEVEVAALNDMMSLTDSGPGDVQNGRTARDKGSYQNVAEKVSDSLQYVELDDNSLGQIGVEMTDDIEAVPVNKADLIPDSSLILNDEFKLSEEDEETIRNIIGEDAAFEPYSSTLELLKEMLLQEVEMPSFVETVTICERTLSEFLRLSRLSEASSLLEHLKKLETQIRKERPRWADRLKDAQIAAGSRGRLDTLGMALNADPEINPAELRRYLGNFGWEALGGITELVGHLEHKNHRDAVLVFLSERSKDNLDLVARGVYDKNLDVVRNAISILARVDNDKALSHLSKLVNHDNADIRMELVLLLRDCQHAKALLTLQLMVNDNNQQIRRAAVNSIVSRRGPDAFEAITGIINNEKFPRLDEDDQQALLSAFSLLGGEKAVTYLLELIITYNHFRNRTLSFLRSAAFEALMVNRSEKAQQTLIKLTRSWRPDIKRQAMSALKRRREIQYGDV